MLRAAYPLPAVGEGAHSHLLELPLLCIAGDQVEVTDRNLIITRLSPAMPLLHR
jgi:hypothetical protein